MKNILLFIAGAAILLSAFFVTYNRSEVAKISTSYSPKALSDMYDKSQYTIPNSSKPISDALLYAHTGYEYIKGDNPLRLNAEHLTTGKYIIGFIYNLTGHIKTPGIFFVLLTFILINSFLYIVTKNKLSLFIFSFFYITDTNIRYQVTSGPLLDIIQLFFFILYIFTLEKLYKSKNKIYFIMATGITLGLMASSKMYIPATLTVLSSIIYTIIIPSKNKLQNILHFSFVLIVALLTYISTYTVYFVYYNGTIYDFIKSQLWILHFWTDNPVNNVKTIGAIIPLVMTNQYIVWWGNDPIIQYEDWTYLWPIVTTLTLAFAVVVIKKFLHKQELFLTSYRNSHSILMLSIWVILFFCYLTNIPISPRYLGLLFVPGYILISLITCEIYEKYKHKNEKQ